MITYRELEDNTSSSQRELEGVIASLRELEDNTFLLLRLLSLDQLLAYNSL